MCGTIKADSALSILNSSWAETRHDPTTSAINAMGIVKRLGNATNIAATK